MTGRVIVGHCLDVLRTLPDSGVQCVVTSPPYWGLRDYGLPPTVWGGEDWCEHEWGEQTYQRRSNDGGEPDRKQPTNAGAIGRDQPIHHAFCQRCGAWRGELGLEPTPELYVEHLVAVMREVRRVLRPDGTLWLNLGDSYAGANYRGGSVESASAKQASNQGTVGFMRRTALAIPPGLKPKDMAGIPWRVALALQADGWWLRSAITWCKTAPMPESVRDRPTKATEQVFMLTKSSRYYYDAEAVRDGGHNLWDYWVLGPEPYKDAHFATMPSTLAERCILAGTSAKGCCPTCGAPWERVVERKSMVIESSPRKDALGEYGNTCTSGKRVSPPESRTVGWQPTCDCDAGEPVPCTVLDCFGGAGTTALAATQNRRDFVIIELNEEYAQMAEERASGVQPRLGP